MTPPPGAAGDTLGARFEAAARRHAGRTALIDAATGARRTYTQLFVAAGALAGALEARVGAAPRVGVLLPPGESGALAHLALGLLGRASVGLNYSLGARELEDTARRAGLEHVVTSRAFLSAIGGATGLAAPVSATGVLLVEDLVARPGPDRTSPPPHRADAPGASNAPATVLFSSGTTSIPKGIVLTHANVLANVDGFAAAFRFRDDDRLLGVLPFFHSFGYTVTLWAPLLSGASVVYSADAWDARRIAALIREHRPTITLATPALYQLWARRAAPDDLASVRAAVVGAQKLPSALAEAWREKYGLHLLEGYGCTELSPVVAVNVPDETGADADVPAGARAGSVGRPLPNVEVEVRDRSTGGPCAFGDEGLLFVRGPSVMAGYLDQPDATEAVLRDGWYETGDVARIDADGFLFITDRLSRFTKIAGEMVPHARVEEALCAALRRLGADDAELAVTTLPDAKRGERLAVVHLPFGRPVADLLRELARGELPRVFAPRAEDFFEVTELPRTGSGKVDLGAVRRAAGRTTGAQGERS